MNQWRTINAVCGHLRAGLLDGATRRQYPLTNWDSLIQVARAHYVATALAWCLRENPSVPSGARNYLATMLRLNGKRNQRLLDVTERIVRALNAIDIEPVLLKGVAHVASGLYPVPGLRLLTDIDVLIPNGRAKPAIAAMEELGFVAEHVLPEDYHHLPRMRQGETGSVVELHTRVEHLVAEPIIPADWLWERTRPIPFRGLRLRVPDVTASIAYNVHHNQLNHELYRWKQVEFRQLLDLAMLRAQYENAIDWVEIDRRYSRVNHGHVLATYLKYAETFFGQPMPKLDSAPRPKAIARLRVGLADPLQQRQAFAYARRHRRERRAQIAYALISMPGLYARARVRDPAGLIKLLSPQTWVRQFQMIKKLFGSKL